MLTTSWPLFGLELRTERLVLRPPTDDDLPGLLNAVDAGIHPPERMPFSHPWTDVEPVARRQSALQFWWRSRAEWSPERWNLLMAVFVEGQAIGVQEVFGRQWLELREVGTGSWLTSAAQGRGYGQEMRTAVLDLAFTGLGAVRARTEAFVDNAASAGVSRALGYRDNGSSFEAPRGQPVELRRFVLERQEWLNRGPSTTSVSGLSACLAMFGLT